jgi:hypothetical protein
MGFSRAQGPVRQTFVDRRLRGPCGRSRDARAPRVALANFYSTGRATRRSRGDASRRNDMRRNGLMLAKLPRRRERVREIAM